MSIQDYQNLSLEEIAGKIDELEQKIEEIEKLETKISELEDKITELENADLGAKADYEYQKEKDEKAMHEM